MDTQEGQVTEVCIKTTNFIITSGSESRMRHQKFVQCGSARKAMQKDFYIFVHCILINRHLSSFKYRDVESLMYLISCRLYRKLEKFCFMLRAISFYQWLGASLRIRSYYLKTYLFIS